jgi:hypothetical protein
MKLVYALRSECDKRFISPLFQRHRECFSFSFINATDTRIGLEARRKEGRKENWDGGIATSEVVTFRMGSAPRTGKM